MPVSINQAYGTNWKTKQRFRTTKYLEWIENADSEVLTQKRYKVSGKEKLAVRYQFYTKWRNNDGSIKKKDVGNYEKQTSDYLSKIITGLDDRQFWKIELEKIPSN